jgi:hypothetical protein
MPRIFTYTFRWGSSIFFCPCIAFLSPTVFSYNVGDAEETHPAWPLWLQSAAVLSFS